MPKLSQSTELGKSVIIKQNMSEGKQGGIMCKSTVWVNFKVCNVSLTCKASLM